MVPAGTTQCTLSTSHGNILSMQQLAKELESSTVMSMRKSILYPTIMLRRWAGTISHQDRDRRNVGYTAHFVASLRGWENDRIDVNPLFMDPYANILGGELGAAATAKFFHFSEHIVSSVNSSNDNETNTGNVEHESLRGIPSGLVECIAIRTRKIDDVMNLYLDEIGTTGQICVLGAGLDTRPWRIKPPPLLGNQPPINYFEIDFPETFGYKLPLLKAASATTMFAYKNVVADLSLPGVWPDQLVAAGLDPHKPTLWVLEGFTGYLTETEFHHLCSAMTKLSAPASRMIATFLTPRTNIGTSMHKFRPEHPLSEVERHGWQGQQQDLSEIGLLYHRPLSDNSMDGYYFVTGEMPPSN